MSTKQNPRYITVVKENGSVTVPSAGPNGAGRVLVLGDVVELTDEFVARVGTDWAAERIASGKYVEGHVDDLPEVRKRRDQIDADALDRLTRYQQNGS